MQISSPYSPSAPPAIYSKGVEILSSHLSYENITPIGFGERSCVVKASNLFDGKSVAIKIISLGIKNTKILSKKFKNLVKIRSEYLVEYMDVIIKDNWLFLIMELCEGGNLRDVIEERGKLGLSECKHLYHSILEGVYFLHLAGIVHRNLKPENILFNRNGAPKIGDYGLSNLSFGAFGHPTPRIQLYKSPEWLEGELLDNECGDVWGIGVLMYYITMGKLPFLSVNDIKNITLKTIPKSNLFRPILNKILKSHLYRPQLSQLLIKAGLTPHDTLSTLADEDDILSSKGFLSTKDMFSTKDTLQFEPIKEEKSIYIYILLLGLIEETKTPINVKSIDSWKRTGEENLPEQMVNMVLHSRHAESDKILMLHKIFLTASKLYLSIYIYIYISGYI